MVNIGSGNGLLPNGTKDIIWTSVDLSLVRFCGIHPGVTSHWVPLLLFCLVSLKFLYLKLLQNIEGVNELNHLFHFSVMDNDIYFLETIQHLKDLCFVKQEIVPPSNKLNLYTLPFENISMSLVMQSFTLCLANVLKIGLWEYMIDRKQMVIIFIYMMYRLGNNNKHHNFPNTLPLWDRTLSFNKSIIFRLMIQNSCPDSKVLGANMGPTWVLSDPDGPHVGPINLAIRVLSQMPQILTNENQGAFSNATDPH